MSGASTNPRVARGPASVHAILLSLGFVIAAATAMPPVALRAQPASAGMRDTSPPNGRDVADVRAVADAALAAITSGDPSALAALFIEGGVAIPTRDRGGTPQYAVRTRERIVSDPLAGIVERGFDPDVRVAGNVATVWYPYDLHVNGAWSHCGVDVFTLVRTAEGWRIASLAWSAEQPPACRRHPDGPPAGTP